MVKKKALTGEQAADLTRKIAAYAITKESHENARDAMWRVVDELIRSGIRQQDICSLSYGVLSPQLMSWRAHRAHD